MSLRTKVLSGLFWVGGARLISQILTWIITVVVIRLLSPDDYGLLAMATVLMSFLVLMAEAGLGPALVQAAEVDELKLRRIFGAVIVVDCALFFLQVAAAPAIARFFNDDRLIEIIRILALQFLLMIFTVIPLALLSRKLDFKRQAIIDLVSTICGSLSTLILALSGHGIWALVIGGLVTIAFKTIAINIAAPFLLRPIFSLKGLHGIVAYGGQVTIARILWFLYSQADILIAGKLLGKELLGYYSVSMHLASLPVQKISSILNQVAFPAFAKAQHEPDQLGLYVLKTVQILSFVAFPVLWGISSIATELVEILLGSKWTLAIVPLQILTLIMPLRLISNILPSATDGMGRPDISVKNLIVANLVMVPAFAIGSVWGLLGLSLAWGCAYPAVFLANLARALPVISLRVMNVLSAMALPAICSAVMYGMVFLARREFGNAMNGLLLLVILVGVGMVTYGLMVAMFNMKGGRDIIDLFKR